MSVLGGSVLGTFPYLHQQHMADLGVTYAGCTSKNRNDNILHIVGTDFGIDFV